MGSPSSGVTGWDKSTSTMFGHKGSINVSILAGGVEGGVAGVAGGDRVVYIEGCCGILEWGDVGFL